MEAKDAKYHCFVNAVVMVALRFVVIVGMFKCRFIQHEIVCHVRPLP